MAVAKRSAVTRHLPIAVPCGQNLVDHASGRRLGLLEERDIERGVARKLAPWLIELMNVPGDEMKSHANQREYATSEQIASTADANAGRHEPLSA